MESSGVAGLIWHFAGYFRLTRDDLYSQHLIYNPYGLKPIDQAEAGRTAPGAEHRSPTAPNSVDDPQGGGHNPREPAEGALYARLLMHVPNARAHGAPSHFPAAHLPHASHLHIAAETFTGPAPIFYTLLAPTTGGGQEIIDLAQANSLSSDNGFDAASGQVAQNIAVEDDMLTALIGKATSASAHFDEPGGGAGSLLAFVSSRDAQTDATSNHLPDQASNGLYLNGAHVGADDDIHGLATAMVDDASNALTPGFHGAPGGPTGDGSTVAEQTVSVAPNLQANAASISDLASATVALAVFGNFYSSSAVIQTNVFEQGAHLSSKGAGLESSPNTVDNTAELDTAAPHLSATAASVAAVAADTHWNVSVIQGNLYDVNSLTQYNHLQSDNVVNETISQTGESLITAGGNVQVNSAILQTLAGGGYGLIIVEGNYHQDNLIYQTNVVLDMNAITSGAASGSAVASGGDQVVNDATIVNESSLTSQAFSASALSVVTALQTPQGTPNPGAVANAFPELSGANVNVLVVTGDYYDINAISQTNILASSNVVGLSMSSGAPAGAEQTVETGANKVVNAASIFDVGSVTSPYVKGGMYSDMILLQTNVIGGEHSGVVGEDPAQLANEVTAFVTNESSAASANHGIGDGLHGHQSADVLGSLMH